MTKNDKGTKFDEGKIDFTLLPVEPLEEIAKVLMFGEQQYGRDDWQGVERNRYHKALLRHVMSFNKGEKLDQETGLHHLAHAACCILFELHHFLKEDIKSLQKDEGMPVLRKDKTAVNFFNVTKDMAENLTDTVDDKP